MHGPLCTTYGCALYTTACLKTAASFPNAALTDLPKKRSHRWGARWACSGNDLNQPAHVAHPLAGPTLLGSFGEERANRCQLAPDSAGHFGRWGWHARCFRRVCLLRKAGTPRLDWQRGQKAANLRQIAPPLQNVFAKRLTEDEDAGTQWRCAED